MSDELQPTAADLSADFGAFLQALRTFRAAFLTEGVDYGVIPNTGRDAKPTLLKPGSEKIAKWLGLRPHFLADLDTWAMAGSLPGLICFRCQLIALDTGEVVGEGQGSAHVDEGHLKYSKEKQANGESRPWTFNNAIKYAEKRAQVDAILRYGCLSAEFTQDLEDQEADAAAAYAAAQATRKEPARPPASGPPSARQEVIAAPAGTATSSSASANPDGLPEPAAIRDLQLKQIRALLPRLGKSEADFEAVNLRGRALTALSAIEAQKVLDWCQAQIKKKGRVPA